MWWLCPWMGLSQRRSQEFFEKGFSNFLYGEDFQDFFLKNPSKLKNFLVKVGGQIPQSPL